MNNKTIQKHFFILACIASSSAFAQSNQSDLKVSANALGGCLLSANNVHFNMNGTEGYVYSKYTPQEGRTETVWENIQEMVVEARCYKNATFKLNTTSTTYNSVGWIQLFHTTQPDLANAPFLVLFPYKSTSENIVKTGGVFILNSATMDFKFLDNQVGKIYLSAEVDHNIGQEFSFLPGDYLRHLDLAISF